MTQNLQNNQSVQSNEASPITAPNKPKSKQVWWAWCCLGAVVLFFILLITAGIVGYFYYISLPPSEPVPVEEQVETIQETDTKETNNTNKTDNNSSGYTVTSSATYDVNQNITLTNNGQNTATEIDLNVALIQDINPFQKVITSSYYPSDHKEITDEEANKYAQFNLTNLAPGSSKDISLKYKVKVNGLDYNLGKCQGKTLDKYIGPEKYIESDNAQIISLADKVTTKDTTVCDKSESIYNYVADNIKYTGYIPEDVGAIGTLKEKGGDCTCFADLFIAMNRAEDIPARFVEGVVYNENATAEDIIKHDWAEVNLPKTGWVPVDPTFGQPEYSRTNYFAATDDDHIIITRGRNLETLDNKHYFYYTYYWHGSNSAKVDFVEDLTVTLSKVK